MKKPVKIQILKLKIVVYLALAAAFIWSVFIEPAKPDIILIGGDLVINGVIGGHPMEIKEVASLLKELTAPLGKFVVLGNHDWWNDGPGITQVCNL